MADDDDVLVLEGLPFGEVVPRGSIVEVYEEHKAPPGPAPDAAEVGRVLASTAAGYMVANMPARFLPERSSARRIRVGKGGRAWYGFTLRFELLADMRAPGRRPRGAGSSSLRLLRPGTKLELPPAPR